MPGPRELALVRRFVRISNDDNEERGIDRGVMGSRVLLTRLNWSGDDPPSDIQIKGEERA